MTKVCPRTRTGLGGERVTDGTHPSDIGGATAKCKDSTWSYRAHARGTCSHHRGVKYWYR
ncbi:DUF3761 domain-containing protein [Streptomyces mirabilis]|uniref:DUF3761 domain-containing protein n=1 Tax=Streptomyces mirabilis TaxID=68239 RepID=UPI00332A2D5F